MDSDKRSKIEVLLRMLLAAQTEVHLILASMASETGGASREAVTRLRTRTTDFKRLWTICRPEWFHEMWGRRRASRYPRRPLSRCFGDGGDAADLFQRADVRAVSNAHTESPSESFYWVTSRPAGLGQT